MTFRSEKSSARDQGAGNPCLIEPANPSTRLDRGGPSLNVRIGAIAENPVTFDQFADPAVQPPLRFPPGGKYALVRYDIVPLVGVLTDWRFEENKLREVLLNHFTEFQLCEIGILQAHVVRTPPHGLKMLDSVQKDAGHIADMDIIAFEVSLKNHDRPIMDSAVHEVVDEKVEAHPWRHAEDCREAETDAVFSLQHSSLRFNLAGAVEGEWLERRFFGAWHSRLADPVAAVRYRHQNLLMIGGKAAHQADSIAVDRNRSESVAVAERCPDERSQRNKNIMPGDEVTHQPLVPAVPPHNIECVKMTALRQRRLAEHEIVNHRDRMAGRKESGNKRRTEITGPSRNEDFFHHQLLAGCRTYERPTHIFLPSHESMAARVPDILLKIPLRGRETSRSGTQ